VQVDGLARQLWYSDWSSIVAARTRCTGMSLRRTKAHQSLQATERVKSAICRVPTGSVPCTDTRAFNSVWSKRTRLVRGSHLEPRACDRSVQRCSVHTDQVSTSNGAAGAATQPCITSAIAHTRGCTCTIPAAWVHLVEMRLH
jgi:hypothetical protein